MTTSYYLYLMKQIADISFLRELQNQGVFVLGFSFRENSNQFLSILEGKIKKQAEVYGITGARLPEALKESFFEELYSEPYRVQEFYLSMSMSFDKRFGVSHLIDTETELLHIQKGERLTVNQPEEYDRCIYLYGPCIVFGEYVSDQYTISSLLQAEINQEGFSCKVVNRGILGQVLLLREQLQLASFKRGDIIVVETSEIDAEWQMEGFPFLNLTNALEKADVPVNWFVNTVMHCNHKVNQICAHEIYKEILCVLQQPIGERFPVEQDHDYINRFYLRNYFSDFDYSSSGTIGSIVMNCNPFTLGHRFLIEEALKTVDFLIVFVVEENKSLFSFQERFAMVCQGTNDLERVMVIPSGPYILSKKTFPEYFQKISDEDLKKNTEDDITLFAEKIAPKLGITYRFVGEEPEDKVTNEYNVAMKKILPRCGIQVVEIPRKTTGQSVISASRVRHCLSMNQMEELDELVPASTKRILFFGDK